MLDCVPSKEKETNYLMLFYKVLDYLYHFINCLASVDIKQSLHYKAAIE